MLIANPKLAEAAEREARKRAAEFLEGLRQYQETVFVRDVEEAPAVFTRGSAQLLSYPGKAAAPAVLLIPSLINRSYVLDLTQRLSFARFLSGQGLNVYVVDWGEPSSAESYFNCGLYVTETLVPMAEWIRARAKSPVIQAGYCMGGLLALALAQIRPDLTDGSAFLATPWNFFVPEFPRFALRPEEITAMEAYIAGCDMMSAETIHTLFHCANPYAFQTKLRKFARMDKASPATQEFLAIEHWVNDGVSMTRGVAHDCLIDWTQRNTPALGQWRVGGQVVTPAKIRKPCFAAVPMDDRIVPAASALPLVKLLKDVTLVESRTGHVGMMVGSGRKAGLWEPFAEWAYSQFT
jgi:polyhydroxyalkanoate synthase